MKKSQISLFIIFGLVILIAFGLIYYLNNQKNGKAIEQQTTSALFTPVRNYIDECVKSSAKEAVLSTALQGGFYNETNTSIAFSMFKVIALYSQGKTKLVPSLQKIEEQISYSSEDSTIACINNFKVFKDLGFEIEYKKPYYKTKILDNQVFFEVNFPIIMTSQEKITKSFDKFSVTVPSRYKLIYNIADQIASLQAQKPDKVCISCLINYAFNNDLNISVTNFGNESIIITIVDKKINVDNQEFVFNFAHSIGDKVV